MKSLVVVYRFGLRLLVAAMFILPALGGLVSPAAASGPEGMVFTSTNAAAGNEVLAYARGTGGVLIFQGAYPTGGLGTGVSLGSQGALALSADGRWLFVVNAGSSQISVLAVQDGNLVLKDVGASGGIEPHSLTVNDDLLYVLNAGGSGNITGFRITGDGRLIPLAGSTRPLSNGFAGAAPAPAEIAFSPDGKTLAVTEKGSNLIDTYAVADGLPAAAVTHPSSGPTPYGFAFAPQGTLVVSEAFGGQPLASALSSYKANLRNFKLVSGSVPTTQTAACWVAISHDGDFAYTTNAGSGTVSSYQIASNGALTRLNSVAANLGTGSSPVDLTFSRDGDTLFVMTAGAHTVNAFAMMADGSLGMTGTISVPAGTTGLAAW